MCVVVVVVVCGVSGALGTADVSYCIHDYSTSRTHTSTAHNFWPVTARCQCMFTRMKIDYSERKLSELHAYTLY